MIVTETFFLNLCMQMYEEELRLSHNMFTVHRCPSFKQKFCVAIIFIILQLNAHIQSGDYCPILRKNIYHFSKASACCKVVTMVEVQSTNYIICGFFLQSRLQFLKQYCLIVNIQLCIWIFLKKIKKCDFYMKMHGI
jgi:hypothetical protein